MKEDWSWKPPYMPSKVTTKKSNTARRHSARQRGRMYIWTQIKALSGISKKCPSNKELRQWAHSHPEILPKEHRPRLLEASAKNLPVELGYLLFGTTKFSAEHKRQPASPKAKASADFYRGWEWKKARFITIKRYGPTCMCCGSTERIVVDHILPRRKRPDLELDLENLQVLCNDCNMGKSWDDTTDFRPDSKELTQSEIEELKILSESVVRIY